MLSSVKLGCLFSVGRVTPGKFFSHLLTQKTYLDLPRIIGLDLQEMARVEESAAGGLDGRVWDEI